MEQTMWQVAEYRHGKPIGWRFFTNEVGALEAAGLSESAIPEENVEIVRPVIEA
jgi:hypothetical protein